MLNDNWESIRSKVIVPMWIGKFKQMYEKVKLDYDDFESLAGIELTKAIKSYNPEKSNIFTFATNVINKKAMTELRNCTQRDKRKTLYISESVDVLGNCILENFIYTPDNICQDELSDKMIAYLKRLSKVQKSILFAIADGFTDEEIIKNLNITKKELNDAQNSIKSYRNVSILY